MNRILSMIGMAQKAGKIRSGVFLTVECIRQGQAKLVIIASDAENNTRKKVEDKCRSYHVPQRFYGTREELGGAIGRELRSCAAVTDAGFAGSIERLIDQLQEERGSDGENENQ